MSVPARRRAPGPSWPHALQNVTDSYLRVSEASPVLVSPAGENEALLFIDLDGGADEVEQLLRAVREVPSGFLTQASYVLARLPLDGPTGPARESFRGSVVASLQENLHRRGVRPIGTGVVDLLVGAQPIVRWSMGTEVDALPPENRLLARARLVELAALMNAGKAIWEPTAYHYKLPSGVHSGRYVRTADAIQRPRDAVVLASWLHRHVRDRMGIVLDSHSTAALAVALGAAAELSGLRMGPTASLNDYPNSQFEVLQAVSLAGARGDTLALMSVSSSGGTRDRLVAALTNRGSGVVEVLVDRQGKSAERLDQVGFGWIGLGEPASGGEDCGLCRHPSRSLVVPIDPRSFAPHAVPDPTLMVPDISDAQDNRMLMQTYDAADSVGIECEPHPSTQRSRPTGNLAFRFYPHRVLDPIEPANTDFMQRLANRFESGTISAQFRIQPTALDALLIPSVDSKSPGIDQLIDLVESHLPFASGHSRIVLDGADNSEKLRGDLDGAQQVLVLTVGSMSGVTLSDINVQVQDHSQARPWALTVHARPSSAREWETLTNSYSGNLAGAWVTLLPERRIFQEEARALHFARGLTSPSGSEALFVERRMNRAASGPSDWLRRVQDYRQAHGIDDRPKIPPASALFDPYAIFWGMPQQGLPPEAMARAIESDEVAQVWQEDTRIRRGSYFGERLRAVTTLTAMGPAMQSAREQARQEAAPVRRQFDLASVCRLYFDPLLLASILRWCTSDEAWWGSSATVPAVLQETLARFDHDDDGRRILLAEMLLGAIMGKVPAAGHEALIALAALESDALDDGDVRASLTWGASALRKATSPS